MLHKLWRDENGAVVSVEIVVIATVLVIALMAAWGVLRAALFVQITEQAEWIAGGSHASHTVQIDTVASFLGGESGLLGPGICSGP